MPRDTTAPLIIVTAYNEQESLPAVFADLREHGPRADVVVIDDGSTDRTFEIARSAGALVVRHPVNLGYGAAVKTGYRYAAEHGYPVACLFDADGQHLAEQLPRVLQPILSGEADLVVGSRFLPPTPYQGSSLRRFGTALFSRLATWITGVSLTDITSGFRAANRRTLMFFSQHYPSDFPEVETILIARKAGLRIREVAVEMRPRLAGHSFHTATSVLVWPLKTLMSILVTFVRSYKIEPPGEAKP